MGASQRFGNPVVSVSNIKYIGLIQSRNLREAKILRISTVYLTGFKHFKIRSNHKNRTSNLGVFGVNK